MPTTLTTTPVRLELSDRGQAAVEKIVREVAVEEQAQAAKQARPKARPQARGGLRGESLSRHTRVAQEPLSPPRLTRAAPADLSPQALDEVYRRCNAARLGDEVSNDE